MEQVRPIVLLLKGINVGGRHRVPMDELRRIAGDLGLEAPRTYVASGNLVAGSARPVEVVAAELSAALEHRFGFPVPVIGRTAESWCGYRDAMPFADAAASEPNLVVLALARGAPPDDAVTALRAKAAPGERVERADDALWIHFAAGVARSALAPGGLDRIFGGPTTTRNLRTVRAVAELAMAGAAAAAPPS